MKAPLFRDIPPRAALGILVLAAMAPWVVGQDRAPTAQQATAQQPPVRSQAVEKKAAIVTDEELDPAGLKRERREGVVNELFVARNLSPVPAAAPKLAALPPAPSPEPPVPVAPPLPFRVIGLLSDADGVRVFLDRNGEELTAVAGRALDASYRVESVTDSAVTLVFLPLNARQILPIPPRP